MPDVLYSILVANVIISFFFHIIINFRSLRPPVAEITSFDAVSRFEGIETYYQSLRMRRLGLPPQEPSAAIEKITARKKICKSIVNSYYFKMRGEEYVDVDATEVRNELQNDYSDIFYSIYKESENPMRSLVRSDNYEYENDYQVRTVHVLDVYEDEYAITCLARGNRSRRIKKYFVTRQYNVNAIRRSSRYIPGRFIFAPRPNNEVRLLAMAEEPAQEWQWLQSTRIIHLVYAMVRVTGPEIARVPNEDPVCKLTAVKKLRLCTSLFGADAFKKKGFKFIPRQNNVLVNCVRKQVAFTGIPQLKRLERIMSGLLFPIEEWTIRCKASNVDGDLSFFYVSSAGSEHEIFVYTDSSVAGHVRLYNGFVNLSMVDRLRPFWGVPQERFLFDDVED